MEAVKAYIFGKKRRGNNLDPDAVVYLDAINEFDSNIETAVNNFYVYLKANNVYNDLLAFWLCIGGTETKSSVNGKNPLLYNLVRTGGVVYSSNGIKPDGTSGHLDTGFSCANLDLNNCHFSYYLRENIEYEGFIGMGNFAPNNTMHLYIRGTYYRNIYHATIGQTTGSASFQNLIANNTDSRGLFLVDRTSSTNSKSYKNNVEMASNTTATSGAFGNYNLYLGARNLGGGVNARDTRQFCFSSVGLGLGAIKQAHLYTAVQTLQTALNRQV